MAAAAAAAAVTNLASRLVIPDGSESMVANALRASPAKLPLDRVNAVMESPGLYFNFEEMEDEEHSPVGKDTVDNPEMHGHLGSWA